MEGKQDPATTATPPAGTRQMGPPAATGAHPDNQEAARGDQEVTPYVILGEPVAAPQQRGKEGCPMLDFFNTLPIFTTLRRKVEELSSRFKVNTAASMRDEEELYKAAFSSSPDEEERLKETFSCYLSTATGGPVAGTLYLTNTNVAFCSDRPLSFTALPGQAAAACIDYYFYKVMIPLGKIATVEPVTMMDSPFPPVKYVHVVTVDSHDFWFMGFVSSDKAVHSLDEAVFQRSQHGVATAGSK